MNQILKMSNISKMFPGVKALDQVDFDLNQGEIHALIGENGAGKSTLMKILGGVYTPDQGTVAINGNFVCIHNPHDSIKQRIGIVYQEFNLVQTLNIYENLYLGKEIKQGMFGQLNRKKMNSNAKSTMERLGLKNIDCTLPIKSLSVAVQQLIEIGKAVFNQIDILILDEPTAVLTDKESQRLFEVIDVLRSSGVAIIYISHRLEEVIKISDRITVLRDGRIISTVDNKLRDTKKDYLVNKMVGRDLGDYFPRKSCPPSDEIVFEAINFSSRGLFENISFQVTKGEILGFSGLIGAGRSEIMKAIFGILPHDTGTIKISGLSQQIKSPIDGKAAGIGFVPEDRKREGLIVGLPLADNIILPNLEKVSVFGNIKKKLKGKLVNKLVRELQIRPSDPERVALYFSGGNQQKGVIAKWLATNPRVMILDEPTRGIDIGAKIEIYHLINELANKGVAVIIVSSELTELIGICDRILAICNGRITGEFRKPDFSQDTIMYAATHFK